MNKYRAVKAKADGHVFDSRAEYRRYAELRLMQSAGHIEALEVHPKYVLYAWGGDDLAKAGVRVCTYTPDFRYRHSNGELVVEDVKGYAITAAFRLKAKIFTANYGLAVTIVKMR